MKRMTQEDMFRKAQRDAAEQDRDFLFMVTDGDPITREELLQNIKKRPSVWGRYSNWLNVLK